MKPLPAAPGRAFFCGGRNLILGLVGLIGSSMSIHQFVPEPVVPGVTAKLERLQQIGHEVTTLFIGSSLVQRQIDPTLFDEILQTKGWQGRSFNLGVDGMRSLETGYLLSKVAKSLPRLRWVFVEPLPFSMEVQEIDTETIRGQYWRDLTQTMPILKALGQRVTARRGKSNAGERNPRRGNRKREVRGSSFQRRVAALKTMGLHLRLMSHKYSNLGRGLSLLRPPAPAPWDELHADRGWRETGFFAIDRELTPSDAQVLQKWVESSPLPSGTLGRTASANVEVLRRVAERLHARGATTILVVSPDAAIEPVQRELAVATGLPYLAFDRPQEYPILYRAENRFDVGHLNTKGAREFTKLLASEFMAFTQKKN